jgi:hypothetical protein
MGTMVSDPRRNASALAPRGRSPVLISIVLVGFVVTLINVKGSVRLSQNKGDMLTHHEPTLPVDDRQPGAINSRVNVTDGGSETKDVQKDEDTVGAQSPHDIQEEKQQSEDEKSNQDHPPTANRTKTEKHSTVKMNQTETSIIIVNSSNPAFQLGGTVSEQRDEIPEGTTSPAEKLQAATMRSSGEYLAANHITDTGASITNSSTDTSITEGNVALQQGQVQTIIRNSSEATSTAYVSKREGPLEENSSFELVNQTKLGTFMVNSSISISYPTITERIRNYFWTASDEAKNLVPMKLWLQHVQWHSQAQLEKEWNDCNQWGNLTSLTNETCPALANRKFIMAMYSCPLQAGNRLHKFTNSMLYGILTNRTVMWRYLDKEACEIIKNDKYFNNEICETANEKGDCDKVLELQDWIPSWMEWKDRLNIGNVTKVDMTNERNYDGAIDAEPSPLVFRIGQQRNSDVAWLIWKYRSRILGLEENRRKLSDLLSRETSFLYGMLLESCFTLAESVLPELALIANSSMTATIALHSRHPKRFDYGSNLEQELRCLNETLQLTDSSRPCVLYLMTDREKTLDSLTSTIESTTNCTVVIANHTKGESYSSEHGPFAGVGYFEDLALAVNARHAMIAPHKHKKIPFRSSSGLVLELIEFRRQMEDPNTTPDSIFVCKVR